MGQSAKQRYGLSSACLETCVVISAGRKFLIATTGIVSGASLIESIANEGRKEPGK